VAPAPLPARPSSPAVAAPAPSAVLLGAYISGAPWDPAKIDAFTAQVGVVPPVVMWYQDWEHPGVREFDPAKMNAVVSRGALPFLTWNPWDDSGSASQPAYALRTIVAGTHDPFIRQWARDAAAWQQPFYLRFAPEMNGYWFPWSPGVNGNTTADYVAAWRHVVDVFRQEGATNAIWVWCPNVTDAPQGVFAPLYPGDGYVDWVALDGYNWGQSQPGDPYKHWTAFSDIFGPSYDALTALTSKPVMIAETASTEIGGNKSAWVTQGLMTDLPMRFPRVRMVIWFDENKETDWRVDSSGASLAAYSAAARTLRNPAQSPAPAPDARG
jgi:beta-mannanase